MSELGEMLRKNQKYLKLGDKETFKGFYIGWERIKTKFGKEGFKFILEREDGSRVEWETSNMSVIQQIDKMLDDGMKRGSPISIYREGTEKENTVYKISDLPF